MKLFEDTIKMNAMFYLTSDGDETTRDDLLREMRDGYPVYMVYLGTDAVRLKLAVQAFTHDGEALAAVQEWARKVDRLDEINEDVECDQCETRPCEDTRGNVALYSTWMHFDREENGISVWKCPACEWERDQPNDYGSIYGDVEQVPESILETAWVLERPFAGQLVHIWSATTQHTEDVPSLTIEDIDDLARILSEEQMKDLRSVYEVVTDNPKIGELIR